MPDISVNHFLLRHLPTIAHGTAPQSPEDPLTQETIVRAQFDALRQQVPTLHLILIVNVTFMAFITSTNRLSVSTYLPSIILAIASATRVRKWRGMRYRDMASARHEFAMTVLTSVGFGLGLAG